MGELTAAKPYHEQALAIFEEKLGVGHPNTPNTVVVRGNLEILLAEIEQAL